LLELEKISNNSKKMRNKILILCAGAFLSACSSGVVPAGPDTYMISRGVSAVSTPGTAKAALYKEASAWCQKNGLVMVPISSDSVNPEVGKRLGYAELTFRALRPGDPEIKRTNIDRPTSTQRLEFR
jgi:hypothetical protein